MKDITIAISKTKEQNSDGFDGYSYGVLLDNEKSGTANAHFDNLTIEGKMDSALKVFNKEDGATHLVVDGLTADLESGNLLETQGTKEHRAVVELNVVKAKSAALR